MAKQMTAENIRVLFVRAPGIMGAEHAHSLQHPINLCCLAAYIGKEGYKSTILDYEAQAWSESDFRKTISEYKPSIIAYTAMTPNIDSVAGIAAIASDALPGVVNIVGGAHTSILPEETLRQYPQFKAAVKGEGEIALLEICRAVRDASLDEAVIPSVLINKGYRGKDGISGNPNDLMRPLDPDSLPFPARELLDLEIYKGSPTPGVPGSVFRATQLFTARGCPGKCIFCCSENIFGRKVRSRTVSHVMAELEDCMERFGFNHFTIDNDTFTENREFAMEFCRRISLLRVTWDCDTRVDRIDGPLLKAMAASGCIKMAYGVETGSPRILKLIRKGITHEQVTEAFRLTREAGMLSCAFFMVGSHPEETEEDIKMTAAFIRKIDPDLITVAIASPYPGTCLREEMEKENLLPSGLSWSDYGQSFNGRPFTRTKTLSPERLQELQSRLLRSFYLRPSYILRRLASIRKPQEIMYWFSAGMQFIKYIFIRNKR